MRPLCRPNREPLDPGCCKAVRVEVALSVVSSVAQKVRVHDDEIAKTGGDGGDQMQMYEMMQSCNPHGADRSG
jgi:hypothetical protein